MLIITHGNHKGVYYTAICPHCGDTFHYYSNSHLLKLLWDKSYFDLDFATHKTDCANAKIII